MANVADLRKNHHLAERDLARDPAIDRLLP
jgi:hypothetical protein